MKLLGIFLSLANLLLLSTMLNLIPRDALAANFFGNETDHLALQEIGSEISDDPLGVLKSWNNSQHHCHWQGVTCSARHQRVIALDLTGMNLFGSISPHIGNLSFLNSIRLAGNRFKGEIPQEVGHLFRLRTFNVSSNMLSGKLPLNLSQCSELRVIDLNLNRIEGRIPAEIGSLKKLVRLSFRKNNMTGSIPPSLWNMSSIQQVSLQGNNFEGHLPREIGLSTSLSFFAIGSNDFSGTIPSSIYNISTLIVLGIERNSFIGNLPADLGLRLPNLQEFALAENQLSGSIPTSITNASKLEVFDLPRNKFEGQVPMNLGNLASLRLLNVESNLLGANSPGDLDFITSLTNCSYLRILAFDNNSLAGVLPKIIGNLSFQLQYLYMGANNISGTIPLGLTRLANLYLLSMELNSFSGIIPSDFGKLEKLQIFSVAANGLSGRIPSSLCNITSLYSLHWENNYFEGSLPHCLGKCQNLKNFYISHNTLTGAISPMIFGMLFSPVKLDLSHNLLAGSLPLEIGRLMNINQLSLSNNQFSGEIPETLGDCISLEFLELQGNFFQGEIPQKLASLKGIQSLDLSLNNLTGFIPRDLERLTFLRYLNLSFNDLEGEVPIKGVFGNASQIMLDGNSRLCGGIPELHLPPCLVHKKKNHKPKLVVIIVVALLLPSILISMIVLIYYQKRETKKQSSTIPLVMDKIPRISYYELHSATAGFSPENLIGSGSFGLVYKGRLNQLGEKLVAVKVLDLQRNGASKSFKAECKALKNIRHRNLVAIITYCSSVDARGQEFKAVVFEFMENGSLDMWLHPQKAETTRSRKLNLLQRLNIAIDIAAALHYLHNDIELVIAHCDLKPSNVLLDNDLTGHLGDFGLARLLSKPSKNSSDQGASISSSAVAVRGSIGYAPPEYGMGCEASVQGDVYSYGILLLEMFTGRRPTDDMFGEGMDLRSLVEMSLPGQVMSITDSLLLAGELGDENRQLEPNDVEIVVEKNFGKNGYLSDGRNNLENWLISIFKIGLKCSFASPKDRMNMNEVIRELHSIKDALFGAKGNKLKVHPE